MLLYDPHVAGLVAFFYLYIKSEPLIISYIEADRADRRGAAAPADSEFYAFIIKNPLLTVQQDPESNSTANDSSIM